MKNLLSLIPRELGRFVYIKTFQIHRFLARLLYGYEIQLWYRNSLLQNYFSFGLSDIDVSIKLPSNDKLIINAEKISSFIHLNPLIKEINFYYPFCLDKVPELINYYELTKDKKLFSQTTKKIEFLEAQKFTYLLRMFFSNRNKLRNGLSERDVLKWSFHFNLITRPDLAQFLMVNMNEKDLLQLIFKTFASIELDNDNYFQAAWHAAECQLTQKSLFIQFEESIFPKELFLIMPHQFCFTSYRLHHTSLFSEQVFVSQLSWEILGMMNQPTLFKKDSTSFEHLNNLRRTLSDVVLLDSCCQINKIKLAESIKSYLDFLNNQTK
ncbi:MAG: hypothetical protein PHY93_06010 [Bacteriovorax sp.]|nr:hypothetical protein [Bacteriovorax sp.]